MGKDWNYAKLSKLAKRYGGPERLVAALETNAKSKGYADGRRSMLPMVFVSGVIGGGLVFVYKKLEDYFKEKSEISQEAVDRAKMELIKGIKEYDALHPYEEDDENIEDEFSDITE